MSRPAADLNMCLRRTDMIANVLDRYSRANPTADRALTLQHYDNLFRLEANLQAVLATVEGAIELTAEVIKAQARDAYSQADRQAGGDRRG